MLPGAAVVLCALSGCWQEIDYDESAADADAPPAMSPAERSDALSEMSRSDVARSAPPVAGASGEGGVFGDDDATPTAQPPIASPDDSPYALPPDDASTEDTDSLFGAQPPDEPPPARPPVAEQPAAEQPAAESSPTVDDLLGEQPVPPAAPTSPPATADRYSNPSTPPDAARPPSTRRLAWLLGSKWSLAALAADRGAPRAEVDKWFNQSQALAHTLGLTLPALPDPDRYRDGTAAGHAALDYLFRQGQQVGRELLQQYGVGHAALLEMAVKSNMLLVLYEPGSSDASAVSSAIAAAGKRAGLPAKLCQPLLNDLANAASRADVDRAVFQLHAAVDQYLAGATPYQ